MAIRWAETGSDSFPHPGSREPDAEPDRRLMVAGSPRSAAETGSASRLQRLEERRHRLRLHVADVARGALRQDARRSGAAADDGQPRSRGRAPVLDPAGVRLRQLRRHEGAGLSDAAARSDTRPALAPDRDDPWRPARAAGAGLRAQVAGICGPWIRDVDGQLPRQHRLRTELRRRHRRRSERGRGERRAGRSRRRAGQL